MNWQVLITNKKLIIKIWWGLLAIITGGAMILMQEESAKYWKELGEISANLAVLTYLITLVPGILKRLNLTQTRNLQLILINFRRHFGISCFWLALLHAIFSYGLTRLYLNLNLWPSLFKSQIGLLALLIMSLLFITSNDWSLKKLKHYWHYLHNLTHIILWLILIHVALNEVGLMTMLIGLVGILNMISFIRLLYLRF